MKKLILIKLGGSVITNKEKPLELRLTQIKKITTEIKKAIDENPDTYFILANGAGSFGHYFATKHNIMQGLKKKEQIFGFCEEQHYDKELNGIITKELLDQGINAMSLHPSSMLTAKDGKVSSILLSPIEGLLNLRITPVLYGAVLYDEIKGAHIYSTEEIFEILIDNFHKKSFLIEKVIYLTTVDGVLDSKKNAIKEINAKNYEKAKKSLFSTLGIDVTGGMKLKLERSIELSKKQIKTYIINGLIRPEALRKILRDQDFIGTTVS